MLVNGSVYKCFLMFEEIEVFCEMVCVEGCLMLFLLFWCDVDFVIYFEVFYVICLCVLCEGQMVVCDVVQGDVIFGNDQLDDMILLCLDGMLIYMYVVVVDDYDMGVMYIICGDDYLMNVVCQQQVYQGMGWDIFVFVYILLIYGIDGKKFLKCYGVVGLYEYVVVGYFVVVMWNYLVWLGWSYGDDELFDDVQVLEWFDLFGIGKVFVWLDFKKLEYVSGYYIGQMLDEDLMQEIVDYFGEIG